MIEKEFQIRNQHKCVTNKMFQQNQNPEDVFTGNKCLLETAQGEAKP